MTIVNVKNYWPPYFDASKGSRMSTFIFPAVANAPQWEASFSYDIDSNSMKLVEVDQYGRWANTWYLRYIPQYGIMEWRDEQPGKGFVKNVLGYMEVRNEFITPIWWGEEVVIGASNVTKPQFSMFKSSPWQWPTVGEQVLRWEALLTQFRLPSGFVYNDVLVVVVRQTWGNKTWGARVWMARGIGWVAYQDVIPDPMNPSRELEGEVQYAKVVTSLQG